MFISRIRPTWPNGVPARMFPRTITLSIVALALASAAASALRPSEDLFTDFAVGWRTAWMERAMASRTNTFRLENESDNRFLRVDSENSASAEFPAATLANEDPAIGSRIR